MVSTLPTELAEKYKKFKEALKHKGSIVIAYSGGVDSALLAKVAKDVLGESAIAVFLDSETVPGFELECAKQLANEIGIKFRKLQVDQLLDESFTKNDQKRCYYCRTDMAKILKNFASKQNIQIIAAGAQATDLTDYRPGIHAFEEAGIWHPFIEFEFSKNDIRQLAKYLGLPVSEKPSMACLSSRIRYGQEITTETLGMIEHAEEFMRKLGFTQYRARTHDRLLRIEVLPEEFEMLMQNRLAIVKHMTDLGYDFVTLDLNGFKSGSMNVEIEKK